MRQSKELSGASAGRPVVRRRSGTSGAGEGVALTSIQMHKRAAEDLDEHDSDFAALRGDLRRLTNWLATAAIGFITATITLLFVIVRGV